VDIIIEMECYVRGSESDRRRRLRAYSRYDQTPRHLLIELNAEGTDYAIHETVVEDDLAASWEPLRMVLEDANNKLTRQQIEEEWPADFERPSGSTLWRCLERAVTQGLVLREGTGRKYDPFRYWLLSQQVKWDNDPDRDLIRLAEANWQAEKERMKREGIPWPVGD
jgi:hypothetical protein